MKRLAARAGVPSERKCHDCRRDIPLDARRCGHDNCGAFQDWRRFIGGQLNIVTAATAVGVCVSIALNVAQIRDLAEKPTRDEAKAITSEAIGRSLSDLQNAIRAAEADLLSIPEGIRVAHSAFLRLPDTGLAKILPRGKYESVMTMRGGGAYFSFANRTNEYGHGSDIELDGSKFKVGFAGLDYGFFLRLGNVPAMQFAMASEAPPGWVEASLLDAWAYAWKYVPPNVVADVRCESRTFSAGGRNVGGVVLADIAAAQPNEAYVLRSISFNESDVLVALWSCPDLADRFDCLNQLDALVSNSMGDT